MSEKEVKEIKLSFWKKKKKKKKKKCLKGL